MNARVECKRMHGDRPCISIPRVDGITETYDCVSWCPLLRRTIAEDDNEGGVDNERHP